MKIGIPREVHPGEKRVAATPATVERLKKRGYEVLVESGAGAGARFSNADYEAVGASIASDARALWGEADLVVKVRPSEFHPVADGDEVELLPEGSTLISLIYPGHDKELVERLAVRKATVLALDCIPRISRTQAMDVLSSQAGISGYRAVAEANHAFGRYFGVQFTAAGKCDPAHVLIIGAGGAVVRLRPPLVNGAPSCGPSIRALRPERRSRAWGRSSWNSSSRKTATAPGATQSS